jgi:ectoine hydroxylase
MWDSTKMNPNINLADIHDTFERDGIVVLPDFLDPDDCRKINDELDRHYEKKLRELAGRSDRPANFDKYGVEVISWHPLRENNAVFAELRNNAQLAQVTTACIGEDFTVSLPEGPPPECLVMLSKSGGNGQAWHQDCPVENATHFNLNRLFYTRDIDVDDGAVVVVPGSHRMGRIPPGDGHESFEGERVLAPKAGTLILLSGHVYHRVTPNISGKLRISVNYRTYGKDVPRNICGIAVYRNGAYDFTTSTPVSGNAPE